MTPAVPDRRFRDQLAEARRAPWVYNEANGWVYGPDPDHAGLRYPYLYAADPEQCRILVARLNADAAEVEAHVQAAAKQGAAEGVDPAEIVRQRALGWPDMHPEDYCHQCGRPNVSSWWVDSPQWNAAVEGENRGVVSILCPPCFTGLWEQVTGESVSWELRIDPRSRAAREGKVPESARPAEPPGELLHAAREWIFRHSSQPDGDRWTDNPDHLDWAARNLLVDLAPWLGGQQ